ncbi:gamma-type small acid-soluble spore protein [Priestia aryabhattai]|uniref:gamma-type small acid-soluble spore protein n=1 Tax=Priestia TaxID=2800373 RepID=UPI00203B2258|nr:gamma-type small acid-soluble spore protein [Priestia aryabhattai]MCM3774303.1 gamma-type small acid-soluble spore protein [Priestia aryabhattai]
MNNNQQSNKTPVGTNAEKAKHQNATYASNKFESEFAGETDLQEAKIEKAYIEGKESQKDNQFDYIPGAT